MNHTNTRRIYLDNIRWVTVCIVVIYHVIYMFNGVQPFGVIGAFEKHQLQDAFQYLVWCIMVHTSIVDFINVVITGKKNREGSYLESRRKNTRVVFITFDNRFIWISTDS